MSAGRGELLAFLSPWGSARKPGLALPSCSGQGEGRSRLRRWWVFLPWLCRAEGQAAPQHRASAAPPEASEAPQEIGSNQDLKGANISQEGGQNPAHCCCSASIPMKNNGSHCQSTWEPRAFFWAPVGKIRLFQGAGSSACHETHSGTEGGVASQRSKRSSS